MNTPLSPASPQADVESAVEDNNVTVIDMQDSIKESDLKSKSSSFEFSTNLMKGITGSVALLFPYIMWQTGLIAGTILNVLIVYAYAVCAKRILELREVVMKEKNADDKMYQNDNDYLTISYHYFGNFGKKVLLVCTLITLWGSNMGTLVLTTDMMCEFSPFNLMSNVWVQRVGPTCILFVFCWVSCLLKNQKLLVSVSSLGLLALIVAFAVLIFQGLGRFPISIDKQALMPLSAGSVLKSIGVILNAYGFMLMLFPLYNELKPSVQPKCSKLVTYSLILVAIGYFGIGSLLFLIFRNDPKGVQEAIIMNVPRDSAAYVVLSITMMLTNLGSFPLLMFPCFEILESGTENTKSGKLFVSDRSRVMSRTTQVLVVSVLAYCIPFFSSINSIIGSFTGILIGQVIPSVMHMMYLKKQNKKGYAYFEDWTITILFTVLMFVCTGFSVVDLAKSYQGMF